MKRIVTWIRVLLFITLAANSIYLYTRIIYAQGRMNIQIGEAKYSAETISAIKSSGGAAMDPIKYLEKINQAQSVEFEILKNNNLKTELSFYGLILNIVALFFLLRVGTSKPEAIVKS